ncbi:MAG: hypothetical protein ACREA9_26800 [Pyrinomonadaceae bacterium]
MKRCPECASGFPDTDQFCERDGTTLVADYWASYPGLSEPPAITGAYQDSTDPPRSYPPADLVELVGTMGSQVSGDERLRQNWKILAIIAVVGVALGLALFVVYQPTTPETPNQNAIEPIANGALPQQQIHVLPRSSPSASDFPSPQPSPSPSVMPSPVTQAESTPVALSSGIVSTGGGGKTGRGPITIRLTNGRDIEADEVWETGDGIWYRRRGVATFLERNEVKAIEKASEKDSSAPASPTPTSSRSISP